MQDVTALLRAWSRGSAQAFNELVPLVYHELHRIAARRLAGERGDHTLQPTALVHELYLKLIDERGANWQNRTQFFAVAAQVMRRVLIDHARARHAAKRGGDAERVSLDVAESLAVPTRDVLDLDAALTRLEALDPRQARVVELRCFAGLTIEETAAAMDLSLTTVKQEWRLARAWLHRELHAAPAPPPA